MEKNVGIIERGISLAFGAAAVTKVLLSREVTLSNGITGAVGATLLFRGATGFCPAYGVMGVDHETPGTQRVETNRWKKSLLIQQPLRDIANVLRHRGMPDFTFEQMGGMDAFVGCFYGLRWTLTLEEGYPNDTTLLRAEVERDLDDPTGTHGLSNKRLDAVINGQLRSLKALAETGESATVTAQPAGQRSLVGKVAGAGNWLTETPERSPETPTYSTGEWEVHA